MNEFLIPSASGEGGLLFYDRSPDDRTRLIDRFWVRVTDRQLSAAGSVCAMGAAYSVYGVSHPVALFADMARQWSGWSGELVWHSIEGELALRCTRDRLGHIAIRVELRSGCWDDAWQIDATVMAEAGQLGGIARRAEAFFGQSG